MLFAPADIDRVRRFWNAPAIATKPGRKAIDMFQAVANGAIKAIWIAATNPADSMPDAGRVREALAKCPLVIAADAWPTDTTRLAHLVLPAASWAEKDGTVTNSERRISRQRTFRAAPGLARPDWWMFAEVARRMGWRDGFDYAGPADIFREHAALSAFENDGGRVFDIGALSGLDDAAYDALAPVQWPCPVPGRGRTGPRLFARGGFPTPDGRARMVPLALRANEALAQFPLTLNTGRVRDQWHTMTRTGRVPQLMNHAPAPSLALHPADAAPRGIAGGGLVRVESPQGAVVMRATIDEGVRPGDVFAAMHWTDQFTSSGPIDRLVHPVTDSISGQPDLKGTRVRVTAVTECWRGDIFRLASGEPELSETVWWSKTQMESGFAFALSGWSPLQEEIRSEAMLRRMLHIPAEAELASYSDPRAGFFRYAGFLGSRLLASAFFGPSGKDFAGAEQARELLGKDITAAERLGLLAGLETAGGKQAGRTICACFSVPENAILDAIRNQGLTTPVAIGAALKAGTNCGSCIPEIRRLLATISVAAA
jgi:assimilatory nitrate reductase catalytic subunit